MTIDGSQTSTRFTHSIPPTHYFGQFIDHDISLELKSDELTDLNKGDLEPLSLGQISKQIQTGERRTLDLDSVYGGLQKGSRFYGTATNCP
jgi:hypothetical protein